MAKNCQVFRRENRNDSKSIKRSTIIDPETGEYKENTTFVDKLYSKKGYIYQYNSDYIKMFLNRSLPRDFSLLDCGRFYVLTQYLVKENQLLGYKTDKIRPLTIEKMCELLGQKERQTRAAIKRFKEKKIIKEVIINDTKWYAINPMYALKSKYLSTTTFLIFQDELIPNLPRWVVNRFMADVKEIDDKVEVK